MFRNLNSQYSDLILMLRLCLLSFLADDICSSTIISDWFLHVKYSVSLHNASNKILDSFTNYFFANFLFHTCTLNKVFFLYLVFSLRSFTRVSTTVHNFGNYNKYTNKVFAGNTLTIWFFISIFKKSGSVRPCFVIVIKFQDSKH